MPPMGSGSFRRRWRLRGRVHLPAETERPHVGPDTLHVLEALVLETTCTNAPPPQRVGQMRRPDRILLFVVDDDFVNGRVFLVFDTLITVSLLTGSVCRRGRAVRWLPSSKPSPDRASRRGGDRSAPTVATDLREAYR